MAFPLHLNHYTVANHVFAIYEPDKEAIAHSYQTGNISFPYWSQVWPAAIGLANFLLNHPCYTTNKKVLELAAGLGLPSVAVAGNAASVVVSDYEPEALAAMRKTMDYNGFQQIQVALLDWTNLPAELATEVLLLSDVSYDADLFALQEKYIRQFLQNETTVIISTPQRLIAKEAIAPLLSFCRHREEVLISHQQKEVAISIFVLQQ